MVAASRAKYRALVHDDPDFPALFQGMTPIDVIERLRSAPPCAAPGDAGVQDLPRDPLVFAWTQCRVVLPGWFESGSGLAAAIEEHGLAAVRAALRDWPALRALASDVEMVLAKSDLAIAARYARARRDVGARLFPVIEDEHARTTAAILEALEQDELLASEPTLQRAIRLRILRRPDELPRRRAGALAEGGRETSLERLLVQTVRGIARGLRNTG